jgi:hypothetical protein
MRFVAQEDAAILSGVQRLRCGLVLGCFKFGIASPFHLAQDLLHKSRCLALVRPHVQWRRLRSDGQFKMRHARFRAVCPGGENNSAEKLLGGETAATVLLRVLFAN